MRVALIAILLTACAGARPTPERPASEGARARPPSERVVLTAADGAWSADGSPGELVTSGPTDDRPAGALPREHIRRKMRSVVEEMRECYETRVLATEQMGGRIVCAVIIAPDGSVDSVSFPEDEIGSLTLRHCMAGVLRGLQFDPPDGEGYVGFNYPWIFTHGD